MNRRSVFGSLAVTVTLALGLSFASAFFFAGPAGAQIRGGCTATIGGESVDQIATPGTALKVDAKDRVTVAATSKAEVESYRVAVVYIGFGFQVGVGPVNGKSWSRVIPVDHYAKYGVGLYRVLAQSKGGEGRCTAGAFIKITGRSPFLTLAGIIATVVGILSLVGLAGGARSMYRRGFKVSKLFLGAFDGLLGAAAAMVLLQQFGVLYPTRRVAALGLLLGIVVGGIGSGLFGRGFDERSESRRPSREPLARAPAGAGPAGPAGTETHSARQGPYDPFAGDPPDTGPKMRPD
jgi:hypothetical protein